MLFFWFDFFQSTKPSQSRREVRFRRQEARTEAQHEAERRRRFRFPAAQTTRTIQVRQGRKRRKQETRKGAKAEDEVRKKKLNLKSDLSVDQQNKLNRHLTRCTY